jgi:hypothetical protein
MQTRAQRRADVIARINPARLREAFSPFASEKAFTITVCLWLEEDAWVCRREVGISPVRIDVLATKNQAIRLVEIKNAWDGHACAEALGQLLLSAPAYPQAELRLATPKRPTPDLLRLLALYHVTLLDGPWL